MCDVLPHTVNLFPGLVYASIVMCYHTLSTCFWVLYVCQLLRHCRPVSESCMCIIVLCDHTFDIFLRFVGVPIMLHYTYLQPDSGSCMCIMSSHKDDLFCVSITMLFVFVTRFHITRLPHTQNQTYVFTRNGLLV